MSSEKKHKTKLLIYIKLHKRTVLSRLRVRSCGQCVTTAVCPTWPLQMSAHAFYYMLSSVGFPQLNSVSEHRLRFLGAMTYFNLEHIHRFQAWTREEKGAIVVVQMSVIGASENRFTHCGSTETRSKGMTALMDCGRARFTFLLTQRLDVSDPHRLALYCYIWLIYLLIIKCIVRLLQIHINRQL